MLTTRTGLTCRLPVLPADRAVLPGQPGGGLPAAGAGGGAAAGRPRHPRRPHPPVYGAQPGQRPHPVLARPACAGATLCVGIIPELTTLAGPPHRVWVPCSEPRRGGARGATSPAGDWTLCLPRRHREGQQGRAGPAGQPRLQ